MNGAKKSHESDYQRVVLKNSSPYHYMKVSLVRWLSLLSFPHIFMLYNLQVGAALDFDVLKYSEDTRTAFLRVPSRGLVNLWSSLTLLGSYQSQACAFRVLQVSSFLLPLTGNSRELLLD
uniref:Ribonuclease P/MRP 14 subunit n=1 Tax=Takifugu rubripes TaxID=31033 RepID=A0A3B5KIT6_TAKRU